MCVCCDGVFVMTACVSVCRQTEALGAVGSGQAAGLMPVARRPLPASHGGRGAAARLLRGGGDRLRRSTARHRQGLGEHTQHLRTDGDREATVITGPEDNLAGRV